MLSDVSIGADPSQILGDNPAGSEMCLEQALQIDALLKQKICPYSLLASNAGVDTGAVIGFSFAVVGGVLGVLCFFVLFIHPHTDDCCQVPMEREVMIAGQAAKGKIAAKGTKTMEDKAIQVSYYKENHPHEPRLKENKLYQLCLKEDQPEAYGNAKFNKRLYKDITIVLAANEKEMKHLISDL
uniref:Uncharacterized protein n=1 Tax=Magallana gigas TaxID=29159 RepID=K1RHI2_MAGGI